jgi:hypothetical protein
VSSVLGSCGPTEHEAVKADASTAWPHLLHALDKLMVSLSSTASECSDEPNAQLAELLRCWSGHKNCDCHGGDAYCGAALKSTSRPATEAPHFAIPLWSCGNKISNGSSKCEEVPQPIDDVLRPIFVEMLVVGDAPKDVALVLHDIVCKHVGAAATRLNSELAKPCPIPTRDALRPPKLSSRQRGFYSPSCSPSHIFPLPACCTLVLTAPSASPREATSLVSNTYFCTPVSVDAHPFNLSSDTVLYGFSSQSQRARLCASDTNGNVLSSAIGAISLSEVDVSHTLHRLYLSSALRTRVAADVIGHITNEAAFNVLRTQQQLGYYVAVSVSHDVNSRMDATGVASSDSVSSLCITVQSSTHTAAEIDECISAFLLSNRAALVKMGPVTPWPATMDGILPDGFDDTLDSTDKAPALLSPFLRCVASLIAQKSQPPASLRDEADRLCSQIRRGTYMFAPRRATAEATALKALSLRMVLKLYDEIFGVSEGDVLKSDGHCEKTRHWIQDDSKARKLAVRVIGGEEQKVK